jgi:hypothetical protein
MPSISCMSEGGGGGGGAENESREDHQPAHKVIFGGAK